MGNHTTHRAARRCSGLLQGPWSRWSGGVALCLLMVTPLSMQVAAAQSAAETNAPAAAPEPAPSGVATPPAAAQAATERPARDQPAPLSDEAAQALAARVEALETLAKGALPEIPIDALLSVSLDDDSSMIERDQEARLEQRRLTIALKQSERARDRSEAALQQLRDQILALTLERRVLALPIEVRERLVQESSEHDAPPGPAQQAPKPEPAEPEKQHPIAPQLAVQRADTRPAEVTPQPAAQTRPEHQERAWLSGWILLVALWLVTFAAARVALTLARPRTSGIPDERREQAGRWAQLGIVMAGLILAPLVSFPPRAENIAWIVGAAALMAVFACKDVAASLLGGLILFVQQPFRVGYQVEIGGVEGRVTEMGPLSVRMLGPQHRLVHVPNREFLTRHVSASPPSGVVTPIQVDFYLHPQDDIADAKRIINEVIQSTRDADASKGRGGIIVSQMPLNGMVMLRLRTKVFLTGTHPEQEIASELTERVTAQLARANRPRIPMPSA